jgi:biotin carboxyl carrier protein
MRRYQITVDGRTFDVRLLSDPAQELVEVEVDGQVLAVEVEAVPREAVPAAAEPVGPEESPGGADVSAKDHPAPSSSRGTVVAPLPGLVKSIAVRPEQRVAAGDELVIIEAMKMENVIRATREGIVDSVLVAAGQHVVHGQPMVRYLE